MDDDNGAAAKDTTAEDDGEDTTPPRSESRSKIQRKRKRNRKRKNPERDSDTSSGDDDGIVIDERLMQTQAVQDLDNDSDYQQLAKRTISNRRENKTQKRFKKKRQVIRSSAAAAREAYVQAREATPNTPEVNTMLRSKTWESVVSMKNILADKGWFKPPPKKSMLLREPACAWYTAGKQPNCLRHKFLPSLNKDVLRNAVQEWVKVHFYLPVAGVNKDGQHTNLMEMFVTYVWGYYTQNQQPKVPALTNVGRFTFTYIWRKQHALTRYFPQVNCPGKWPRYSPR